jgi:hypothetical protein
MMRLFILAVSIAIPFSVGAETVKYLDSWTKSEITKAETVGLPYEEHVYDDGGNLISKTQFKVDPIDENKHIIILRYVYTCDEHGNKTSVSYFIGEGKPGVGFAPRYGVRNAHRIDYTYDENGKRFSESYFGIDGEPVLAEITYIGWDNHKPDELERGVHMIKYPRDDKGFIQALSYYGINNEPIIYEKGMHRVDYTYDERRNKTSERYYGIEGEPVTDKSGVHLYEYDYRGWSHRSSENGYDAEGNLIYKRDY